MYVLNRKRQILLIAEMTQLRRDEESWAVYYHHPSTNAMWKSFFPKATPDDHGPKILRTEPVPSTLSKRLENCLSEENPENAEGLAIELSTECEQWEELMQLIEANYRSYNRRQLPLFLKTLGIEHPQSLFRELNKNPESCSLNEDKLKELTRRSKKIRFKRFWFP